MQTIEPAAPIPAFDPIKEKSGEEEAGPVPFEEDLADDDISPAEEEPVNVPEILQPGS